MAAPDSLTKSKSSLNNYAGFQSLIVFAVLALAWLAGFSSRLFAVIRFESIIHEFDPWFNYRATHHMVEHGFYNFLNWFDERAWYPLGRIVGGTVYPGLMVTSGLIHHVLNTLNIPIHIRDVCVFLAPLFSGLTAISMYFFTKEIWSQSAGLLAACFIAIVPGYISRSVAGSYDNEGIAIFALMFTYYLWIKTVKTGSVFWAIATAIAYFYMVSAWGGYVFIINLIPLHVFVLILMGRYSSRLYTGFCTFYIVGTLLSMQIPFVGFQPIRTSEHMAAAGVFALLNAYAVLTYIKSYMTKSEFKSLFVFAISVCAGIVFLGVVYLTYAGYVAPWSGRFYSLWDTGYAKIHIPIIASVSEHQPTTWVSFLFDLHVLSCVFPAGVWFVIKNINDERVFVVLYATSAIYFAGVMVRLMLTLTPIVCVFAAIAFSHTFENYLRDEPTPPKKTQPAPAAEEKATPVKDGRVADRSTSKQRQRFNPAKGVVNTQTKPPKVGVDNKPPKKKSDATKSGGDAGMVTGNLKSIIVMVMIFLIMLFCVHCTWVTSNAYSSPSIVLASYNHDGSRMILDDFREAYYWLRQNTDDEATVMSWWDYGYQIAGMGNKTTLVDNNTWNNSHIALVGKAMSSNETAAYDIMKMLGVDYVLVIFGGVIGYSGDDINKFLWMVRIAEGEHPQDIKESDYFTPNGEFRVDSAGSKTLLNCLMYKLCYYRFGELQLDHRSPPGFDRTRNVEIGHKNFKLKHVEEAYTTEHWLVRIYKVLKDTNVNKKSKLNKRLRKKTTTKTSRNKKGTLGNQKNIVRGVKKAKSAK